MEYHTKQTVTKQVTDQTRNEHSQATILAQAADVLKLEAEAILQLRAQLNENFYLAVKMLLACSGRVVVSGMGKSGHIARKIAATLASTGTPAFFVHPAEASHGDLGMITAQDVVLALSNSGETAELVNILTGIKRLGAKLIALTGNSESSLAKHADIHLSAAVEKEACPLNLAPTSSTTAALALGDALAVCLLEARGFNENDFARSHPGGALGRRLLTYVRDVMRTGESLPIVLPQASISDALLQMTQKRMGMTAIVDEKNHVLGIFTDGDLRRVLEKNIDMRANTIASVMTKSPRTIQADQLAAEAVAWMERFSINQLLVCTNNGYLEGALNMHDLFSAKVI